MKIRLSMTGRGYDLAEQLPDSLDLPDGATVDDALSQLHKLLPDGTIAATWLVAVSGQHIGTVARHSGRPLHNGDELLLIAPTAGG